MGQLNIERRDACWIGRFSAMASPCEIHLELNSKKEALKLLRMAMGEAQRIERKFSRYINNNVVWQLNNSRGETVCVDEETARLLDFSAQCYELSCGLFDITSGVLRKAWNFDGSDKLPSAKAVDDLRANVGWQKLSWSSPQLTLPQGMEIDFGGIGKEYAVDRTIALLGEQVNVPFLVNYGGDLHASAPPEIAGSWVVAIESVKRGHIAIGTINLHRGALTTSGDAQRYVQKDGVRYSHVINPVTGWPTPEAPSSVTVAGNTCVEAGVLSTLAMLKGADAESFLDEQDVTFWCQR